MPGSEAGTQRAGGTLREGAEASFRMRVVEDGPIPERCPELGPCHLWTGCRYTSGYGYFWNAGRAWYAHRVSYALARGPIPPGKHVLHRCDNPPCVNPAHLFLGTQRTNNDDRDAKGRVASGGRSGRATHPEAYPAGGEWSFAKLTDAQVAAIRGAWEAGGVKQTALGRLYNVHQSTINRLVRRKRRTQVSP